MIRPARGAAIAVPLLLLACFGGRTPVADLVAGPRQFAGREVTVSGVVLSPAELGGERSYVLEDRGAKVLVMTEGELPRAGDLVKVRAKVIFREDTSTAHGMSGVKLREIDRR